MKKLLLIMAAVCLPLKAWSSAKLYEEIEIPEEKPEQRIVNVPFQNVVRSSFMPIVDLVDLKKITVSTPRSFEVPVGFPLKLMNFLVSRVNGLPSDLVSIDECSLSILNPKTKEKIGISKLCEKPDVTAGKIKEAQRQVFEFHRQKIKEELAPFMEYIFQGGEPTERLLGDACELLCTLRKAYGEDAPSESTLEDEDYAQIFVSDKAFTFQKSTPWKIAHPDEGLDHYVAYFINECFLPFITETLAGIYSEESGFHATSLHAGRIIPLFWLIDRPIPSTMAEREVVAKKITASVPYFSKFTEAELFGKTKKRH